MKKKVSDCSVWDLISYCEQRDAKYGIKNSCKGCQFRNDLKGFCPVNEIYECVAGYGKKTYEDIEIEPYTHG